MGESWWNSQPDVVEIAFLVVLAVAVIAICHVLNRAWNHDCGYPDCDQRTNPYHSHVTDD